MNVGRIIRVYRTQKGISQGDMAGKLSISQNYLSQLEKNHKKASFTAIEKFAEILGVSVELMMIAEMEIPKEFDEIYMEIFEQVKLNSQNILDRLGRGV